MLGNIPPFVGFSTVKDSALVLPTFSLPGTENPESVLDVNFQLVLKKMYKKDSTTKLKVSSRAVIGSWKIIAVKFDSVFCSL